MPDPLTLRADVLGWARTAHYVTTIAEDGDLQLRSEAGAPTRYYIRRRGTARWELTQTADGDDEHPVLFVADITVLDRYLVGLFADDIREDLALPFLDLSWDTQDLAPGYELSDMVRGYRTLSRSGSGPVAAAPDSTVSLVTLVPLSHMLGWSIGELKRSFLHPAGAPFLRDRRYASR
ncbi:hypothetical protein Mycsm_07305 (plasmid) [Mycobacterium sp. JS623]|uniref:Imm61 family immunity protein n=1 Tax=Mycobacterium sp. JS623 TaxID=212767 RepID=UPI0002A55A64|nr:Imm61 family immunity protein [Mycobacterium sp. JS623]AGB27397.1 hypothetical protein Mycsm_07305 [Mycobacterium sp. JS623]